MKCTARQDEPHGHGHDCTDLENHSAGCHLCSCGLLWRDAIDDIVDWQIRTGRGR